MSTSIIVAGRNRLFCECLAEALIIEGLRATYLCEETPVATQRILAKSPNVLLVDVHLEAEEMLELTAAVTAEGQKVLVIGAENRDQTAAATAAGAMGYTWQETSIAELFGMIEKVRQGQRVEARER
ncbi:MAG: hypothetical protein GY856_00885 [bacterium]|nr:hypothetical protein [bacterium]